MTRAKSSLKSEDFSAHDLHSENVMFWACATWWHTIAYKHIDNLFKNDKYVCSFLVQER